MSAAPHPLLEPYRPGLDGPFDLEEAGHLLRRTSFGGGRARRQELVDMGLTAAVATVTSLPEPRGAYAEELQLLGSLSSLEDAAVTRASWLARMLHDPHPFREVLTLFWHGHFATSIDKVGRSRLMERQLETLRNLGPGSLRALLMAVARDPAMILWLDGNANRRHHPNENFARELFELFTLGQGQYAEADVAEAARAFTGWHERGGRFRFAAGEHDDGPKRVLAASGDLDGDDVIDAALAHPACAEYVGAKLFAAFVRPDPDAGLKRALGVVYREHQFDTRTFLQLLFASRAFFQPEARRALVASPVALAVGTARTLGLSLDTRALVGALSDMGQVLLAPPSVKGWDGGLAWLNTATLVARANLATDLATERGRLSVNWPPDERPLDEQRTELRELLLDDCLPAWAADELLAGTHTRAGALAALLSLPEAQFA